jgi:hypothetical protein
MGEKELDELRRRRFARLADALIGTVEAPKAADRPYSHWLISQPMANWLADQAGMPRGPVDGAHLLGRPCWLANDPGGLRLEVSPPRRWLAAELGDDAGA